MKKRVPLIVDPDISFLKACEAYPAQGSPIPLVASTGREAQAILSDSSKHLLGTFVNPNVKDPGGVSVIRCAHLRRPGSVIYLLRDPDDKNVSQFDFSEETVRQLGVQGVLKKPITYPEMAKLVMPTKELFESTRELLNKNGSDDSPDEPIGQEITLEDKKYIPIRAENYLSASLSYFDVYVRLKEARYVKILKRGDRFSPERVVDYIKKGVEFFYIPKALQEPYLQYCDKLTSALIQKPEISVTIKISQVLNHGEEVIKFLNSEGINESKLNYAYGFVANTEALIKKCSMEEDKVVSQFMKDLPAYDHGVATCMVSALIMNTLRIENESLINLVGLASVFHDVSLLSMPPEVRTEFEEGMSPEHLALYHTHPVASANILKGIYGINETTLQIIEQHHMRKGQYGFPKGKASRNLLQMSEVVGFSENFCRLIAQMAKTSDKKPLTQFLKALPSYFSEPIVSSVRRLFKTH